MKQSHIMTTSFENFEPERPYNNLPLLSNLDEQIETRTILKQCIEANISLAQLKQLCDFLPDATILVNTLPLIEAQASSEIENIVTTRDALFRQASASQANTDPATREAYRYRSAMRLGFEEIGERPMSIKTATTICSTIKNTALDIRKLAGTALANERTGKVIYTPPEGERIIRNLLDDMFQFLHMREEIDPLVRLAIAHYQFEAIHPFSDGNGRTGRILNVLFLISQGLLNLPALYLSGYINSKRNEYYQLLLAVTTHENWEAWISFMLQGITESADEACQKIEAIRRQMRSTSEIIQSKTPRLYSRELIDVLFRQPYCRIGDLVDADLFERRAASRNLHTLEEIGILKSERSGRDMLFINHKLLEILLRDKDRQ